MLTESACYERKRTIIDPIVNAISTQQHVRVNKHHNARRYRGFFRLREENTETFCGLAKRGLKSGILLPPIIFSKEQLRCRHQRYTPQRPQLTENLLPDEKQEKVGKLKAVLKHWEQLAWGDERQPWTLLERSVLSRGTR